MGRFAADLQGEIATQIYRAAEDLGATPELLGILGSYGDTLPDEVVLSLLTEFNETGSIFKNGDRRRVRRRLADRREQLASSPIFYHHLVDVDRVM